MVKKRERVTPASVAAEEAFISGADQAIVPSVAEADEESIKAAEALSPKAPRKYKVTTLPLNQYESELISAAAEASERSLTGFIRAAAIKAAKKVLEDEGL